MNEPGVFSATVAAIWTTRKDCLHAVGLSSVCVLWLQIQLKHYPDCRIVSVTFDVSVYNHVAVQVGDSLKDLPGVSPCHLLCQGPVGF